MELDIYTLTRIPGKASEFIICNRSNSLYLADIKGNILKKY